MTTTNTKTIDEQIEDSGSSNGDDPQSSSSRPTNKIKDVIQEMSHETNLDELWVEQKLSTTRPEPSETYYTEDSE